VLRTRVLTAVLLAPLALYVIFGTPVQVFMVLASALLMVGCWEFRRLAALDKSPAGWLLLLIQAAIMAALLLQPATWEHAFAPMTAACFAWLLLFLRLPLYRPGTAIDNRYRLTGFATALVVITSGWFAMLWIRLQEHGAWWLMVLLAAIWAADVGAYFVGRAFGRRKLAPQISPGKTWAGLFGGLLTAVITALAAIHFFPSLGPVSVPLAILIIITVIVSAGGDLLISLHKRITGVKDAGRLFPGHGGVLDRLDSLLAGAPFFALGLQWMDLA
jgi:phosphatidate cytidylyltransferase